jgi:Holliday junction resolvase RusA-like endonuclease
MEEVWIIGFPLAPSVNKSLVPVRVQKGVRLVKTHQHLEYINETKIWALSHFKDVQEIKSQISGQLISIEFYFMLNDKAYLRSDTDNRIKPTQDALTKILETDDKHIIKVTAERLRCKAREHTIARISSYKQTDLHPFLGDKYPWNGDK